MPFETNGLMDLCWQAQMMIQTKIKVWVVNLIEEGELPWVYRRVDPVTYKTIEVANVPVAWVRDFLERNPKLKSIQVAHSFGMGTKQVQVFPTGRVSDVDLLSKHAEFFEVMKDLK